MTAPAERPNKFSLAYDTSLPGPAFSNGFEGDVWQAAWCGTCEWQADCPLIDVALLGRIPAAWAELDRGSLANRYQCRTWSPAAGYVQLPEVLDGAP